MNASGSPEAEHQAYLCLGSNIDPAENLRKAVDLLRQRTHLLALSTCWETEAVGSSGPNFLNIGALIETRYGASPSGASPYGAAELKEQVLSPIENELGRVRSADKYAPRTIDLDITIFDGQILDPEIWRRVYMALIFAEMLPGLRNPESGETLGETARRLRAEHLAIPHPELAIAA